MRSACISVRFVLLGVYSFDWYYPHDLSDLTLFFHLHLPCLLLPHLLGGWSINAPLLLSALNDYSSKGVAAINPVLVRTKRYFYCKYNRTIARQLTRAHAIMPHPRTSRLEGEGCILSFSKPYSICVYMYIQYVINNHVLFALVFKFLRFNAIWLIFIKLLPIPTTWKCIR